MKILTLLFLSLAFFKQSCDVAQKSVNITTQNIDLFDQSRSRRIPVQIYYNPESINKKLVIISPGYKMENTEYYFLAEKLAEKGYTIICIQQDLPTDEPVASTGNLYELRLPVWERGVKNIQFVVSEITKRIPDLDSQNLVLIGHSMGGDISMFFARKYPEQASVVISLDHRRMPIPRISKPGILSIRADEFQADEGVLPSENEQKQFGIKIITLKNTKHSDLSNTGSSKTKQKINHLILNFLIKTSTKKQP